MHAGSASLHNPFAITVRVHGGVQGASQVISHTPALQNLIPAGAIDAYRVAHRTSGIPLLSNMHVSQCSEHNPFAFAVRVHGGVHGASHGPAFERGGYTYPPEKNLMPPR